MPIRKGKCSVCSRLYVLRDDDTVRLHNTGTGPICPGSRKPPAPSSRHPLARPAAR